MQASRIKLANAFLEARGKNLHFMTLVAMSTRLWAAEPAEEYFLPLAQSSKQQFLQYLQHCH